jgi:hypothetical protein
MSTLLSPIILFFILGVTAGLFKSTLKMPTDLGKGLSIYLMLAIGFKGGVEIAHTHYGFDTVIIIVMALLSGLVIPIIGFFILSKLSNLDKINRANIAAHYGSISVVTFIAATSQVKDLNIPFEGYIIAVVAMMEAPAIVSGLLLVKGKLNKETLKEVLLNGSIVLLLGSLAIGWVTSDKGMATMEPFIDTPFKGILGLFLLDMGLLVAEKLRKASEFSLKLLSFGVFMPLVSASLALLLAMLIGLDPGTAVLLMTLCASASYIAVPAAMRVALPEANAGLSLTLSLGVTFPFNVTLGIPLYIYVCEKFL